MVVPEPIRNDPFPENRREDDAGAAFVLESKGYYLFFKLKVSLFTVE